MFFAQMMKAFVDLVFTLIHNIVTWNVLVCLILFVEYGMFCSYAGKNYNRDSIHILDYIYIYWHGYHVSNHKMKSEESDRFLVVR